MKQKHNFHLLFTLFLFAIFLITEGKSHIVNQEDNIYVNGSEITYYAFADNAASALHPSLSTYASASETVGISLHFDDPETTVVSGSTMQDLLLRFREYLYLNGYGSVKASSIYVVYTDKDSGKQTTKLLIPEGYYDMSAIIYYTNDRNEESLWVTGNWSKPGSTDGFTYYKGSLENHVVVSYLTTGSETDPSSYRVYSNTWIGNSAGISMGVGHQSASSTVET